MGETILLVDENIFSYESEINHLEKAGYKVLYTPSGQQAFETYSQNKSSIDLVIITTDIHYKVSGYPYKLLEDIRSINLNAKYIILCRLCQSETDNLHVCENCKGWSPTLWHFGKVEKLLGLVRYVLDGLVKCTMPEPSLRKNKTSIVYGGDVLDRDKPRDTEPTSEITNRELAKDFTDSKELSLEAAFAEVMAEEFKKDFPDPKETESISQIPNEALATVFTARDILKGLENPIIPEAGPEHDLSEEEELFSKNNLVAFESATKEQDIERKKISDLLEAYLKEEKKKESTLTETTSENHTISQSYSEKKDELTSEVAPQLAKNDTPSEPEQGIRLEPAIETINEQIEQLNKNLPQQEIKKDKPETLHIALIGNSRAGKTMFAISSGFALAEELKQASSYSIKIGTPFTETIDRRKNIGRIIDISPIIPTQQDLWGITTPHMSTPEKSAPETENNQPKKPEEPTAFTVNQSLDASLDTSKLPDHVFTNTKLQVQTVLSENTLDAFIKNRTPQEINIIRHLIKKYFPTKSYHQRKKGKKWVWYASYQDVDGNLKSEYVCPVDDEKPNGGLPADIDPSKVSVSFRK
jgi:CheY-like chemotaxis protein